MDIDRNGYQCTGKPEPLSGNLAGYWSVRIDEKNEKAVMHLHTIYMQFSRAVRRAQAHY